MPKVQNRKKCLMCGKTLPSSEFWKYRDKDGEYSLCKKCLTKGIDVYDKESFDWILKEGNYPWSEFVWCSNIVKQTEKKGYNFEQAPLLGIYFRSMGMRQYKGYYYGDDIDSIVAEQSKANEEEVSSFIKKMRIKFENGEIPEAQYKALVTPLLEDDKPKKRTFSLLELRHDALINGGKRPTTQEDQDFLNKYYNKTVAQEVPEEEIDYSFAEAIDQRSESALGRGVSTTKILNVPEGVNAGAFYNTSPIGNISMPQTETAKADQDVLDNLSPKEIQQLTLKWGESFRPSEWIRLEDMFNRYSNEYELNVDREETLKKICKTSIKMDEAMDDGDITSYKNLSAVLDQLRKSAKFTEAQRQENAQRYVDSVGELVAAVEAEGGIIRKFDYQYHIPQDKVDLTLKDMQAYTYNLVKNEMGLGDLIESYIKKLEEDIRLNQNKDAADGLVTNAAEERALEQSADDWIDNLEDITEAEAESIFNELGDSEVK